MPDRTVLRPGHALVEAIPPLFPYSSAFTGGEATCRRASDHARVECSGVTQVVELWNYTKSKLVRVSPTYKCGYYTNYAPRCAPVGGQNFFTDRDAKILGCDQAYVIVHTTVRLPVTNTVRTGTASTSNFQLPEC